MQPPDADLIFAVAARGVCPAAPSQQEHQGEQDQRQPSPQGYQAFQLAVFRHRSEQCLGEAMSCANAARTAWSMTLSSGCATRMRRKADVDAKD